MWKSDRKEVDIKWIHDRAKHWTHSRDYMLWSFFQTILTAILDPKDWYAIRIKADPEYESIPEYNSREEKTNTQWETHRI